MKLLALLFLVTLPLYAQASQVCGEIEVGAAGCDVDICGLSFKAVANGTPVRFSLMDQGVEIHHDYDVRSIDIDDLVNTKSYCVDIQKVNANFVEITDLVPASL